MKNILEEIWSLYDVENDVPDFRDEEKSEDYAIMMREQKKLYALLDNQQREQFEKYSDCANKLDCISERQAYIRGIRFATRYLISALSQK